MKKIMLTQEDLRDIIQNKLAELGEKKGVPERLNFDTNPSISLTGDDRVKVTFENEAYKKMRALIKKADKEVGWYGCVARDGKKEFRITDILLFPQTVTGVTVTTDDAEFVNWQNQIDDETFNCLRFYGHSHVNMGVTPSTTDDTFFNDTIQNVNDFYIFGIFNKNNSAWFNIYDVESNILYGNTDIQYLYIPDEKPKEEIWAEEQIEEYVKAYVAPATTTGGVYDYEEYYNRAWNRHNNKSNKDATGYNSKQAAFGGYAK